MPKLAPTMFTAMYIAVVGLSAIPTLMPGAGKFAAVYLVVTTFPWTPGFLTVLAFVNPSLIDDGYVRAAVIVMSTAINAAIVYWFFARRSGHPDHGEQDAA